MGPLLGQFGVNWGNWGCFLGHKCAANPVSGRLPDALTSPSFAASLPKFILKIRTVLIWQVGTYDLVEKGGSDGVLWEVDGCGWRIAAGYRSGWGAIVKIPFISADSRCKISPRSTLRLTIRAPSLPLCCTHERRRRWIERLRAG